MRQFLVTIYLRSGQEFSLWVTRLDWESRNNVITKLDWGAADTASRWLSFIRLEDISAIVQNAPPVDPGPIGTTSG